MLRLLSSKKKVCMLYGKWTECMYTVDPAAFEAHKKNDKKVAEEKKSSKQVYAVTWKRDVKFKHIKLSYNQ